MTEEILIPKDAYQSMVWDIQKIFERRKKEFLTCLKRADNTLVMTHWEIGKRILQDELQGKARAGYGEQLIPKLARELKIVKRELFDIVRFAKLYPAGSDIRQEILWAHYRILSTCEDKKKRNFYEKMVIEQGWSKRELQQKILLRYYEKHGKEIILPKTAPLIPVSREPQEYIQEIYDFSFLRGLKPGYSEKDVEILINRHLRRFLNELGPGFYMGLNQKNIFRKNEEIYRLDWEAYSRKLRCICVIDLKIGSLHDRDVAQMIRYLLHYDRTDRMEGENPAIGLILCEQGAEKLENYLVEPFDKRIFASHYRMKTPFRERDGYAVYQLGNCASSGGTMTERDVNPEVRNEAAHESEK